MVSGKETVQAERKQVVSFSKNTTVRLTMILNDYTDTEKHACWYTSDEMNAMKDDIRQTLNYTKRDKTLDDDIHFSRRGLETITGTARKQKMDVRRLARDAVLDEQGACRHHEAVIASYHQSFPHLEGEGDVEDEVVDREQQIADRYVAHCTRSREAAYLVGLTDAKVACVYYCHFLRKYGRVVTCRTTHSNSKKSHGVVIDRKPKKSRSFRSLFGGDNKATTPTPASLATTKVKYASASNLLKVFSLAPSASSPSRSTLDGKNSLFLPLPRKFLSPAAA